MTDDRPRIDTAHRRHLHAHDCPAPAAAGLPALAAGPAESLRQPGPGLRDGEPHVVPRTRIRRDVIGRPLRARPGAVTAGRFEGPGIQAHAFAPLVLDALVARDDRDPTWGEAFRRR
ncbi:hypothetical protein [Streptomyces omiyaensis]|uniref:Uncharacterized protein n=1 Tax=Streptomyces omiyaensis TaxID=68247 RepID=A0ABW7BNR8_9ACTN|nr:hypothetical protein [Streptomyces omiyaensis]GGY46737.1 hypothetical protein GCM10010363_29370 [Streptomyces omiyaensis]